MAAAYRMASLNSWPTAWHHCGNGKKVQTSMERRLFVGPMARYSIRESSCRRSPASSYTPWCRPHG
ncbi:hypothetical protein FOFC_17523 [Fusarium oxysporum]|nr:hypothetical protein FOFC_17523 [Fusarium oxysporum]